MVLRIVLALFCLLIVLLGLYLIPGGPDLYEIIPANTGGVAIINQPFSLFQKTAESGFAKDLHQVKSMSQFFQSVDKLLEAKKHFSIFSLFVSEIAITVPADLGLFKGSEMPLNTYIKVGRGLKIFKLIGLEKSMAEQARVRRYQGYKVHIKDGHAMAMIGGYWVLGSEDGVYNAILCKKGTLESLAKKDEKKKQAQEFIDNKADLSMLLFTDSYINALPWPVDPHFLIDSNAFLTAGGNLTLENDRIQFELTALQQEGKLLLPNAIEKPSPFTMTRFLQDDQFMAMGAKFVGTGVLTDPLLANFSRGSESKLKQKIMRLTVGHMLAAMGPEVGVIFPVYDMKSPAFLFQIKDRELLEKSLNKFQNQFKTATDKLSALFGQSINSLVGQPDLINGLIDKLPEEDKSKAQKWMKEMTEAAKAKGEAVIAGMPIHFEIMGDFLVLSRYTWVLDRLRSNYEGIQSTSKTREILSRVDEEGSMFLIVDLLEFAKGSKMVKGEEVLPILSRHSWKSAVSLQGGGSKTTVKASVAVDFGTSPVDIKPSAGLLILFYGVILIAILIWLLAIFGFYRSIRWILANR